MGNNSKIRRNNNSNSNTTPANSLSLSLSLSHRETTGVKRYLSIILCSFVTFCVSLICSSSPFITSDLTSHVIFIYLFLTLRFVPQRERQHGIGQSKDFVENPPSVLGTHNTNIMGESACQVARCFLSTPCFFRVHLYLVSTIFLSLALNNLVRIYFLSARLAQKIFR